jgi:hypothetical protein
MYGAVRKEDRYAIIHSCGDVDELFDDLVAFGVNRFNPFQPEVMNIHTLMDRYRGRSAGEYVGFHRNRPGTAAAVKLRNHSPIKSTPPVL